MFSLILFFPSHRNLPSDSFASGFPSKILYDFIFPLHHTNQIFLDKNKLNSVALFRKWTIPTEW
jgi:hypothetical protein